MYTRLVETTTTTTKPEIVTLRVNWCYLMRTWEKRSREWGMGKNYLHSPGWALNLQPTNESR